MDGQGGHTRDAMALAEKVAWTAETAPSHRRVGTHGMSSQEGVKARPSQRQERLKLDANVGLLVGICALCVILLASVESGTIGGVLSPGFSGKVGLVGYANGTLHRGNVTSATLTTVITVSKTTLTTGTESVTVSTVATSSGGIASADWLLPVLVAALVLIGFLFARLPTKTKQVVDLEGDFEDLRRQKTNFDSATSFKVRNAALIHYYTIVRKVCAKVGLVDAGPETPREYIARLSSQLKADPGDALAFAAAVDEAMYGTELPPEKVSSMSNFMESFTETIRRTTLAG